MIVVVFDSDESAELVGWIKETCAAALAQGLLVLATGALPGGHWHCSIAKNTAHKVAMETYLVEFEHDADAAGGGAQQHASPLDTLFLLNLDGDNLLGTMYTKCLNTLLRSVAASDSVGAKGGCQGSTGRVGMWATHFVRIGGYDQSYLPSGFQDVCLHQRVKHLGGSCRTITGKDVGLSIPNDLINEKTWAG